jgi:hypothetical protein
MATQRENQSPQSTRLWSFYLEANEEDGLGRDSVLLCQVLGGEIQSVSLRVADDAMLRWKK